MRNRVGIIGAGVVGTAVGIVLGRNGYEITGVYDVDPESTEMLRSRTDVPLFSSPCALAESVEILFITVNDSAIARVAEMLADNKAYKPGQMIVHMSGSQSSETLERARDCGAFAASIHPLQAFASPDQAVSNLEGSIFSVEGDEEVHEEAARIVQSLGGEHFVIERHAKPLYHAGACVVSNYLVTIIDFGVKLLESTGIPSNMAVRALLPLIRGTVRNVENIGLPKALTGPIARGDLNTVIGHLDSLEKLPPELLYLYSWLGFYTARIALEKGSISEQNMEDMQGVFLRQLSRMATAS